MYRDQWTAPDPYTVAAETAARDGVQDAAQYAQTYTQEVVDGSQAVQDQTAANFANDVPQGGEEC
jgi:hypothetical protein